MSFDDLGRVMYWSEVPRGLGDDKQGREGKDFLVHQAIEQAALEQVTLCDLERRMMYFSESDPGSCDKPSGTKSAVRSGARY
jgi:hypothetical protein